MANYGDWIRTGIKEEDDLYMYDKGLHYDCTFQVGSDSIGPKV
jgi:hypothetical protein